MDGQRKWSISSDQAMLSYNRSISTLWWFNIAIERHHVRAGESSYFPEGIRLSTKDEIPPKPPPSTPTKPPTHVRDLEKLTVLASRNGVMVWMAQWWMIYWIWIYWLLSFYDIKRLSTSQSVSYHITLPEAFFRMETYGLEYMFSIYLCLLCHH